MQSEIEKKYSKIKDLALMSVSTDPIDIANSIMNEKFINIHGPEHHYIDGASFLAAYRNSGGDIDLSLALDKLAQRTLLMPGAMCGYWGVCGSVTSLGAALSIISGTSPLSNTSDYADNMEYTSSTLRKMSEIGGPRCCKRNAYLSLLSAVDFLNSKYSIQMKRPSKLVCTFSSLNRDCIGSRCPFHR